MRRGCTLWDITARPPWYQAFNNIPNGDRQ